MMSDWIKCPLCGASPVKQSKHCATNAKCTWHHCHQCKQNYVPAPKKEPEST